MTLLDKILGRQSKKSGNVAKERLQLVLIHDRVKLSPGQMEQMRQEIVDVISKYVDIDLGAMAIEITSTAKQNRLVADIPIVKTKSQA